MMVCYAAGEDGSRADRSEGEAYFSRKQLKALSNISNCDYFEKENE